MANPQPKAPPLAPPTEEQLRKALDEEKAKTARLEAEGRSYLDAARSEWNRAEQAQEALRGMRAGATRPPEKDPFVRLSEEGLALDPEKQQELLDRGVRGRIRQELGASAREQEQRRLAGQYELETKLALNFFRQSHPTIVQDVEGFAAAMTRAQVRAEQQGMNPDPVSMLNMGLAIYNEGRSKADEIPYTEGAGMAGGPMGQQRTNEKPPPSLWEKLYGAKDVVDEENSEWSLDSMTEKYLDQKNLELVKEGFTSKIGQIMGQLEEAKARRAATAAA